MKGMVKFLQQANKLKILKRAGWVKLNIENPESVADHTYRTAMMAIVLLDALMKQETRKNK